MTLLHRDRRLPLGFHIRDDTADSKCTSSGDRAAALGFSSRARDIEGYESTRVSYSAPSVTLLVPLIEPAIAQEALPAERHELPGLETTLEDVAGVVHVTVVGRRFETNAENLPVTVLTLQLEEALAGTIAPPVFELRYLGGRAEGGAWLIVGDAPVIYEGEEYVFLLRRGEGYHDYPFVGGALGVLRVVRDSFGGAFLVDLLDRPIVRMGSTSVSVTTLDNFEPNRPYHLEYSGSTPVGDDFPVE